MKQKLALPIATLLFTSCPAQKEEKIDPFVQPDPTKEVPAEVVRDPFKPLRQTTDENPHLWKDHVVKSGGANGPDYVRIGGAFDKERDQVAVLLRVGVQQYQKALEHPDRNRGVGLLSDPLASPEFTCWLRPFRVTDKTAEFIVLVSRKRATHMYLFFIPQAGSARYLYELGRAAQDIVDKK
jgi:hypothetical protein